MVSRYGLTSGKVTVRGSADFMNCKQKKKSRIHGCLIRTDKDSAAETNERKFEFKHKVFPVMSTKISFSFVGVVGSPGWSVHHLCLGSVSIFPTLTPNKTLCMG